MFTLDDGLSSVVPTFWSVVGGGGAAPTRFIRNQRRHGRGLLALSSDGGSFGSGRRLQQREVFGHGAAALVRLLFYWCEERRDGRLWKTWGTCRRRARFLSLATRDRLEIHRRFDSLTASPGAAPPLWKTPLLWKLEALCRSLFGGRGAFFPPIPGLHAPALRADGPTRR